MRATSAAALAALLTACIGGSGGDADEPRRYLLDRDGAPCVVEFGPMWPLVFGHVIDVAEIAAPAGRTWISTASAFGDRESNGAVVVDGTEVSVYTDDGTTTASWYGDDAGAVIVVRTTALDEAGITEQAAGLVRSDGIEALAAVVAGAVPDAEVRYAGPAVNPDLGVSYDDRDVLYVSGRPVSDAQDDATYGGTTDEPTDDGWLIGDGVSFPMLVANGQTVVQGEANPVGVPASAFRDVLADLASGEPTVSSGEGLGSALIGGCGDDQGDLDPDRRRVPADDAIDGVEAVAVDGGWNLRIRFSDAAATFTDTDDTAVLLEFGPRLRLLTTLDIADGERLPVDEVTFDALLTEAEAQLFVDLLG